MYLCTDQHMLTELFGFPFLWGSADKSLSSALKLNCRGVGVVFEMRLILMGELIKIVTTV